jgi:hypothetical protein
MGGFTPFADWDDKIVEGARQAKQGTGGEMYCLQRRAFLATVATLVRLIGPTTTVAGPAETKPGRQQDQTRLDGGSKQ